MKPDLGKNFREPIGVRAKSRVELAKVNLGVDCHEWPSRVMSSSGFPLLSFILQGDATKDFSAGFSGFSDRVRLLSLHLSQE
jgi:hypothetical protein